MRLLTLVKREMLEQRSQLLMSLLAVVLGTAALVAVRTVLHHSEKAVAGELDALGANILILPKSATVQDYYAADLQSEDFPEAYIQTLIHSDLKGLDNLSPKLNLPVTLQGRPVVLTGILPNNEFKSKATWQAALNLFEKPEGCGIAAEIPIGTAKRKGVAPPPRKIINDLGVSEVLVGSEVAGRLKIKEAGKLQVADRVFEVKAILPPTGTVDDNRVFAHLRAVQTMGKQEGRLSAIEIVGCCSAISDGLVLKINKLLPDAKVVTIAQIVDTQVRTNRLMSRISVLFFWIVLVVAGAGIANYMYADVFERTREIGTLMAMGASSKMVLRLFIAKGLILGAVGSLAGYLLGTLLAWLLGPWLAGLPVRPLPGLALAALGLGLSVSLIATLFPAMRAARMDPSTALREL